MSGNVPSDFENELSVLAKELARHGIAGLEALYDFTAPRLLRYAQFLTRTQLEADDVIQASFLRLARYPRHLSRSPAPWPYLLKLVRNEAYNLFHKRKAFEQMTATMPYPPVYDDSSCDAWERSESVRRAIRELPAVQAEVVTLKIWEGLTFREIAEITDEPLHTVTSRYRYGLEKLSVLLRGHAELDVEVWFSEERRQ